MIIIIEIFKLWRKLGNVSDHKSKQFQEEVIYLFKANISICLNYEMSSSRFFLFVSDCKKESE